MADVFISYAREDRPHAERLARGFERNGLNVWWDLESLRSGQSFNRAIQQALEQASCVVVLWSRASVVSPWVESEAYWAWQNQKLHSVRLDDAVLLRVPFNTLHARTLAGWDGGDEFAEFRRLLDDLQMVIGPAQAHRPTPEGPPHSEANDHQQSRAGGARRAAGITEAAGQATDTVVSVEGETSSSEHPEAPAIGDEHLPRAAAPPAAPQSAAEPTPRAPTATERRPATVSRPGFALPAWSKTLLVVAGITGLVWLLSFVIPQWQGEVDAPPGELTTAKEPTADKQVRALEGIEQMTALNGIEDVKVLEGVEDAEVLPGSEDLEVRSRDIADAESAERPGEPSTGAIVPEMVTIPAGAFRMGCVSGKGCNNNELPQRTVTFDKPFAIGKYEVTFAEYDRFAEATEREKPSDRGWGRGKRPVINVGWDDAQAYASWLSEQTGKRYRLPSEAEWEHAARGGTSTDYWWGDDIQQDDKVWANCNGCGSEWDFKQTAPVGSFPENPFGLKDTAGNVLEWVQDCWHDNYAGAPTDGSAWEEAGGGDCGRRVVRGGSWLISPELLRSAYRFWNYAGHRYDYIGFRLAQDL